MINNMHFEWESEPKPSWIKQKIANFLEPRIPGIFRALDRISLKGMWLTKDNRRALKFFTIGNLYRTKLGKCYFNEESHVKMVYDETVAVEIKSPVCVWADDSFMNRNEIFLVLEVKWKAFDFLCLTVLHDTKKKYLILANDAIKPWLFFDNLTLPTTK